MKELAIYKIIKICLLLTRLIGFKLSGADLFTNRNCKVEG